MDISGKTINKDFKSNDDYHGKVLTFMVDHKFAVKKPAETSENVLGFFMEKLDEKLEFKDPFHVMSQLFTHLTHVDVQECRLISLDGLAELKQLNNLNANTNFITSIRDGSIPDSLQYLYLRNNQIDLIEPLAKEKLLNLKAVDMQNNKLIDYKFDWSSNKEESKKMMQLCNGQPCEDNTAAGLMMRLNVKLDKLIAKVDEMNGKIDQLLQTKEK